MSKSVNNDVSKDPPIGIITGEESFVKKKNTCTENKKQG